MIINEELNQSNKKNRRHNKTIENFDKQSSRRVPRYIHCHSGIDKVKLDKTEEMLCIEGDIFFQKSNIHNEMSEKVEGGELKQQVELFFSFNPINEKMLYSIQPHISKKGDVMQIFENLGTSIAKFGKQIDFDNSFVIEYYFETQQNFHVKILDSNKKVIIGSFETSIAKILGSKGQTLILKNPNLGVLTIKGLPYNQNEDLCVDLQINLSYPDRNIKPFYLVKRNVALDNSFLWINAYKSEVHHNYKNTETMNQTSLKIQMLSSECSLTKPFLIEFYDFGSKQQLGSILTTVAQISDEKYLGKLQDQRGEYIPNTKITFNCQVVEEFKFLDYLRGGLQLSMIFGIDYTASNGEPNDVNSLHYIKSDSQNDYQKAIKSCGDIVAFYDYDQLFPVFGYGAILKGSPETNFCFNCNFKEDPNVNTIDGVLDVYKKSLTMVKLYGPTYFSPIVKKAIDIASEIVNNKDYIYSILIILTDGKINDMKLTTDYLVRASYLPISIIIVGIGEADFAEIGRAHV